MPPRSPTSPAKRSKSPVLNPSAPSTPSKRGKSQLLRSTSPSFDDYPGEMTLQAPSSPFKRSNSQLAQSESISSFQTPLPHSQSRRCSVKARSASLDDSPKPTPQYYASPSSRSKNRALKSKSSSFDDFPRHITLVSPSKRSKPQALKSRSSSFDDCPLQMHLQRPSTPYKRTKPRKVKLELIFREIEADLKFAKEENLRLRQELRITKGSEDPEATFSTSHGSERLEKTNAALSDIRKATTSLTKENEFLSMRVQVLRDKVEDKQQEQEQVITCLKEKVKDLEDSHPESESSTVNSLQAQLEQMQQALSLEQKKSAKLQEDLDTRDSTISRLQARLEVSNHSNDVFAQKGNDSILTASIRSQPCAVSIGPVSRRGSIRSVGVIQTNSSRPVSPRKTSRALDLETKSAQKALTFGGQMSTYSQSSEKESTKLGNEGIFLGPEDSFDTDSSSSFW